MNEEDIDHESVEPEGEPQPVDEIVSTTDDLVNREED